MSLFFICMLSIERFQYFVNLANLCTGFIVVRVDPSLQLFHFDACVMIDICFPLPFVRNLKPTPCINKSHSMADANTGEGFMYICNFDLENVGQGCRARLSHWFHLVANINVCKGRIWHFYTSSYHFQDINIWNIWFWQSRSTAQSTTKVGQQHRVLL